MSCIFKYYYTFFCLKSLKIKNSIEGFPGGSVLKNLPANAVDVGLIPASREIPHAEEQIRLCATTVEPVL